MTYFIKQGNSFMVSETGQLDIYDSLPVGTYTINQDRNQNFYLERIENFSNPSRLYGDTEKHSNRILSTFKDRDASTGVLLAGEKGSGKSLLAKVLSAKSALNGISTIVINKPWHGDDFNKLIQGINQPCVILFDEFEKVYDRDKQEKILTLLDGMFPTKKLFVFTCNELRRIDEHLVNRPGRVYYMLEFKGLDENFICEYAQENLKNKDLLDGILTITPFFRSMNFDILKALIEEMNRYNEPAPDVLAMLNARPSISGEIKYSFDLFINNNKIERNNIDDLYWRGNPLSEIVDINYREYTSDGSDYKWVHLRFNPKEIILADPRSGKFVLEHNNARVVLTEEHISPYMFI